MLKIDFLCHNLLKLVLLNFFFTVFISKLNAQDKPNIILILADDVGYYTPTVNGGQSYSTPRIDSMARHGMNFKNCHSTPLCSTSRCMLLTGKYNIRNYSDWAYMNPTDKTIANLLKGAGYATGIFGKQHAEYSVDTMKNWGWDYHCIFELTEYNKMPHRRYKDPVLMENGTILNGELKGKYCDDVLTDKIFSFIQANKAINKPFFVYYPMSIGHVPFCPTPDDSDFATWDGSSDKSDKKYYPSMMKYMDKIVGRILDSLKKLGIDQNTLVIFSGDNGTPVRIFFNAHGEKNIQGQKGQSVDGGTHVPLMAYWPGHIAPGSVSNDLIDFSDFFKTFAQAAGISNLTKYGQLDGISFYNTLLGKSHQIKKQLFNYFDPYPGFVPPNRWTRNKTYKLYDSSDSERPGQFFNVVADENEIHPLSDGSLTAQEKLLKKNFQSFMDSMGTWPACPLLKNASASKITAVAAVITGTIVSSGATPLIDRGSTICDSDAEGPYLQIGRMHAPDVALGTFSMKRTGLNPESQYRYTLYGINQNQAHNSGFIEDSFYTLSKQPVTQPVTFTGTPASTSVTLKWRNAKYPSSGATKAGYLLVYSKDSIKIASPPDGKSPAEIVLRGTIVPLASTTLPAMPPVSAKATGLSPGTVYHFMLIPYTWNGSVAATYSYLTKDALKLTTTTTTSFNNSNANANLTLNSKAYIEQNTPNPSNTNTSIKYYLPSNIKNAQIVISDVNGKVVGRIALNQKGTGQVDISAKDFLSGDYFYSLVIDGKKVDTKKMQLIK